MRGSERKTRSQELGNRIRDFPLPRSDEDSGASLCGGYNSVRSRIRVTLPFPLTETRMAAAHHITVAIDSVLLKRVQTIAARRGLSVAALLVDELRCLIVEDEAYEAAKANALALLDSGFSFGGARTRRVVDLTGKIEYIDDYDYKAARKPTVR